MESKAKYVVYILLSLAVISFFCKVQIDKKRDKPKTPMTDSEYVTQRFEKLKNNIGSTDELIKLPKIPFLKGEYYCLTKLAIPVSHKMYFTLKEGKVELLNQDNLYKFSELLDYNEELSKVKVDTLIEFIQNVMYNGTSGQVLNSIDDLDKKTLKGLDESSISLLKKINITPIQIHRFHELKEISCFMNAGYLYLLNIKIKPKNSTITYKQMFDKPVEKITPVL